MTASLAKGKDGHTYLALVNLDPEEDADIALNLKGEKTKGKLDGQILTANQITAKNTFSSKEVVKPKAFSTSAKDFTLPAKSIVVVAID